MLRGKMGNPYVELRRPQWQLMAVDYQKPSQKPKTNQKQCLPMYSCSIKVLMLISHIREQIVMKSHEYEYEAKTLFFPLISEMKFPIFALIIVQNAFLAHMWNLSITLRKENHILYISFFFLDRVIPGGVTGRACWSEPG